MELTPKQKSEVQFNGEKFDLKKWSIPYTSNVHEWKKEFVAKFKFDYNGKWIKIKE
jgi:hypothetical protein